MERITMSSFGRQTIPPALLAGKATGAVADKWAVLRDLGIARAAFGVTDRDLGVLSALLSFLPGTALADDGPAIVHASNQSLCARAHGMAESTLRRHLSALVAAGLIHRHDSPNGKRFVLRGVGATAFGLDLSPLAARADEIAQAAQASLDAAEAARRHRLRAVLALRDAAALLELAPCPAAVMRLADLQRAVRRKLQPGLAESLAAAATALLADLHSIQAEETSGSAVHSGRHCQSSTKDSSDIEPCQDRARAQPPRPDEGAPQALPLYLVTKAAPDIETFGNRQVRHWSDLVAAADHARPMLGISADAWAAARAAMGDPVAAITLACILQSATRIRSPGGYLRALTERAGRGEFSPGPMVMALLRADNATPA